MQSPDTTPQMGSQWSAHNQIYNSQCQQMPDNYLLQPQQLSHPQPLQQTYQLPVIFPQTETSNWTTVTHKRARNTQNDNEHNMYLRLQFFFTFGT